MSSVSIEIPSENVIVLTIIGAPPASRAPFLAPTAKSLICILHGVTSLHVLAIPIIGFLKSLSVKPTARSIARFGDFIVPSNTLLLIRKSFVILIPPFLYIPIILLLLKKSKYFSFKIIHSYRNE